MATKKTTRSGTSARTRKRTRNGASLQHAMQEQRKIERMLDEEFESLAQARRELRKQSEALSKRAEKQLAATEKRIAGTTKQIEEIGELLGEEFESLAQATRALRNETVNVSKRTKKTIKEITKAAKDIAKAGKGKGKIKVKKPAPAPTPKEKLPQPINVFRDLTKRERITVQEALRNPKYARELDKLLKPGEYIVAQIPFKYKGKDGKIHTGYAQTKDVFTSFKALFKKLNEYLKRDLKRHVSVQATSTWLNRVQIMTSRKTEDALHKDKERQTAKHQKEKFVKVKKITLTKIPPAKKQTKKRASKKGGKKK